MASRPANVPETAKWIMYPDCEFQSVEFYETKQEALDQLEVNRDQGDRRRFFLYAPDSCHEIEVRNKVIWERFSG